MEDTKRFLLTETQLQIMKQAFTESRRVIMTDFIDNILIRQAVGKSQNPIEDDLKKIKRVF